MQANAFKTREVQLRRNGISVAGFVGDVREQAMAGVVRWRVASGGLVVLNDIGPVERPDDRTESFDEVPLVLADAVEEDAVGPQFRKLRYPG